MELQTRHFGSIEVDEKGIIHFPEGIPGFKDMHRFALLSSPESGSPFKWLQCIDNGDLAFVVIDPKIVIPDYFLDIDDSEVEILNISDPGNVMVFSVVVIPDDISKMSANLKAPILINTENNRGKQVVAEKGNYSVRHYILDELRRMGGE